MLDSYVRDVKKPFVELLAACALLPLGTMGLHVDPDSRRLVALFEVLMIIVFLMTAGVLRGRIRRLETLKGGGPFIWSFKD